MVCRTGPSCSAIRSSSWSRRYGVAVRPEPPLRADLPHRVLERRGRDVMALVDDHEPVAGGQLGEVVAAGQRLERRDVDRAAHLRAAAAELARG